MFKVTGKYVELNLNQGALDISYTVLIPMWVSIQITVWQKQASAGLSEMISYCADFYFPLRWISGKTLMPVTLLNEILHQHAIYITL